MTFLYKNRRAVRFPRTNESLDSVVGGLDVGSDDDVLSICGSGDQPLAILEKARSVVAVDIDSEQLSYALTRVELIQIGKFSLFRNPDVFTACSFWDLVRALNHRETVVSTYFTSERLCRIQARLQRLTVRKGDIFEWRDNPDWSESRFDKVYLSNALDAPSSVGNANVMSRLLPAIKQLGLIYVTDRFFIDLFAQEINGQLELDEERTNIARRGHADLLHWNPGVYRKIAI